MFFSGIFWVLNKIIFIVGSAISFIISLLPKSPFQLVQQSQFGDFISKINFFFPIYDFLAIGQLWIIAIAGYYIYSIWARWIKAIE